MKAKDWITSGSRKEEYEMGFDEGGGAHSYAIATAIPISSRANVVPVSRTLMQSIQAERYLGKRLHLKMQLKAQDRTGAATIWLRVDGERRRNLAFDNMDTRQQDGPLIGTTGWQDRSVVLDVPPESLPTHFGFYLRGGGSTGARRVQIEEVDESVTVTEITGPTRSVPANLDFRAVA